jgi:ribonuclease HII
MDYENEFLAQGKTIIIGMDEAGYGAWAGPVVAGAVCLPFDNPQLNTVLHGVKDSKQMTRLQREAADVVIRQHALGFGTGEASPQEISTKGLSIALSLAYSRAYEQCVRKLQDEAEVLLIDGKSAWKAFDRDHVIVERIPKGDTLSLSIAAASVLAKVWRDGVMRKLGAAFPAYGFEQHVGYGTARHRHALERHGVLDDIHRRSYKPIAALID